MAQNITENTYVIGIDPGVGGAISIIEQKNDGSIIPNVYAVPIIKTKATNKTKAKNEYDIKVIVELLKPLEGRKVFVCLEKISAMPGNGSVSMFHFGEGFGIWKGILGTLGFNVELTTPMTWKKEWGDTLLKKLEKPEILKLKTVDVNRLSASERKEYKETKKKHKQEQDRAKKNAKDNARELAGKLYPNLKESFELKKDDGKAEALLIAEYLRRQLNVRQQ